MIGTKCTVYDYRFREFSLKIILVSRIFNIKSIESTSKMKNCLGFIGTKSNINENCCSNIVIVNDSGKVVRSNQVVHC